MAFVVSAVCGLVAIPRITAFCRKKSLYDLPCERKVHSNNIPRLGGTCFMPCMFLAAILSVGFYRLSDAQNLTVSLWSCMFAASLLMVYCVGVVDDIVGVRPVVKLLVQLAAACLLPFSGLYINCLYGFLGIGFIPFYIGAPLTVFVFAYVVNAMNLIDGIDGLAGSLSLMALLGFLYCFLGERLVVYSILIAGLAGVVVAFLYYNMTGGRGGRCKIFMGDSGSLTLGFILAFLLVKFSMFNPSVRPFGAERLLLSYTLLIVPCFDVVRVVLSRLRSHQPLFKADKRHIHHKLLRCGLSQHAVLGVILLLQAAFVVINIALYGIGVQLTAIVAVDVAVFVAFHLAADMALPGNGKRVSDGVKRAFDVLLGVVALVVFSPLLAACYIAVLVDYGAPAIYRQERIGLHGRPFYIYKFRSMRNDAEKDGPVLCTADVDTRLTGVGRFLRDHHLDELPQLWNVVRGDMSFVGPRPERRFFIDQIMRRDARYELLYQIRPGVTSYATLYNGYTDTMEKMLKRLELDLYYLDHRSWWLDVSVLWKTFASIVSGKKF